MAAEIVLVMMMMMMMAGTGYYLYLQGQEADVMDTEKDTDEEDEEDKEDEAQELEPDLFGTLTRTDAERAARVTELTQEAVAVETAGDGTETYTYTNEREQYNTRDGRPTVIIGVLKLMKPGTIKNILMSGSMKSGPDSTCSAHRIQVHTADGTKVYDRVQHNGGSVEWKDFTSTFPASSAWTNLPAGSTVTMLLKNVEPQCNSIAKAGITMKVEYLPNEEFISIGQIRRDRKLQRLRRRALQGL
jgi:hypothetical protein